MKNKLVLLFGDFNIVHKGHLELAEKISKDFDYFRFIPFGANNFEKKNLSFQKRTKMLDVATKELQPKVWYDPILENAGLNEYQTARLFRSKGFDVTIIIGTDKLNEVPKELFENFETLIVEVAGFETDLKEKIVLEKYGFLKKKEIEKELKEKGTSEFIQKEVLEWM